MQYKKVKSKENVILFRGPKRPHKQHNNIMTFFKMIEWKQKSAEKEGGEMGEDTTNFGNCRDRH